MEKDALFGEYKRLRDLYYAICRNEKPRTENGFKEACARAVRMRNELSGMLELLKAAEVITEEEAYRQYDFIANQFNTVGLYRAYTKDDATVMVFYPHEEW